MFIRRDDLGDRAVLHQPAVVQPQGAVAELQHDAGRVRNHQQCLAAPLQLQDLLEAQIYPLALNLDDPKATMNKEFFYQSKNHLMDFDVLEKNQKTIIKLIDVSDYKPGYHLELTMDDEKGQAIAYLMPDGKA